MNEEEKIVILPLSESPLEEPRANHVRYVQMLEYVAKVRANMEVVKEHMAGNPHMERLLQYMEEDASNAEPPEIWPLTGVLYNASENCKHVVDPWAGYSGVHCLYCKGWYCA